GTGTGFPIFDAGEHAGRRCLAGIGKIGPAKIKVDVPKLRTNAPGHRDFRGWLARQFYAGNCAASVKHTEGCFEGGADRRLAGGDRGATVDVVGCKSGAEAEL